MKITIEFDPFATVQTRDAYSNSKTNTIRKMLEQVADRIDDAIWCNQAKSTLNPALVDRNGEGIGSVKIRLAPEERA
jgi:hypothetical protein